MKAKIFLGLALLIIITSVCFSPGFSSNPIPEENNFSVIAYYHGNAAGIDDYPVEKLTHIIFSFLHLKGNKLAVDNAKDSLTIQHLVSLKKRNPGLKIILSLGGWGGCETCSEVFANDQQRRQFAESVKQLLVQFKADGLDLDWEYPSIEGYPGHQYLPEDKQNFTSLVQTLRTVFGNKYELSFAAGAFTDCLKNSVEWNKIMPLLDKVNLMTYDLVNGYSKYTGHHTPLFSAPSQKESADNAIRFLDSIGVERNKIIIGAAFYARVWENVEPSANSLFKPGKFKHGVDYKDLKKYFDDNKGFEHFWDSVAKAPYSYNAEKQLFATFDDERSITIKTRYAIKNDLGGIMFWQLGGDYHEKGLLDVIDKVKSEEKKK